MSLLKTIPVMEELEAVVVLDSNISRDILRRCGLQLQKTLTLVNVIVTAGEKGVLKFSAVTMTGKDASTFNYTYLFQLPLSSLNTAATTRESEASQLRGVSQLLYLPNAQELVACTRDHNIIVHSLQRIAGQAEQLVDGQTQAVRPLRVLIGNHGDILDLVRIPQIADETAKAEEAESRYELAVITNSPQLRLMNRRFECQVVEGHEDIVLSVDVSEDG